MKFLTFLLLLLTGVPVLGFQSIAILPFANHSPEQRLYWLGEGFAESLSEELMLKDAYLIQRQQRKAAYDELKLPYSGDHSRATMRKIAQRLGVDYLVFGFYNLNNGELMVETRVIKLSTSELSQPISSTGKLEQLFEIQTAIRNGLIRYFRNEKLETVEEKPFQNGNVPLYAYELYIKALLEPNDNEKLKLYQRAIQVQKDYQQAIFRTGVLLSRLQRYRESSEFLTKVQFQGIIQAKAQFLIGLNFYYSHDYEAAYRQWLELSKSYPTAEVYNNIAVALMKKNDIQNSGWYIHKAVELAPWVSGYHFNLAASYIQRKYDRHAIQKYRDAIQWNPSDYQAMYLAGKLMEREEEENFKTIARRMLQLFQETLPSDQKGKFPEPYNSVVQLLRVQSTLQSAEEREYERRAQEKSLRDRAEYVQAYQVSARKYLEEGKPDLALMEIRKGAVLDPLNWQVHYLWGWALVDQKKRDAAIPELEFSIWCQDNVESRLILAELYRQSQRYADAKLQVQRSLAIDPNNKKALDIWNKIWDKE